MKTRKEAAAEIYQCMSNYEKNLALSYATIYRCIFRDGNVWRLKTSNNTNHYDYTA